jgi:pimeloyl-ACP methyl ester carboxylesterase
MTTTIVLVHGALTDASVWHGVIGRLQARGHTVLAPAMPLRSLAADAEVLNGFLRTIDGPILVAAHSYAGSIISDPAALTPAVRALAFVAAFQPDQGETTGELNGRFPGGKLGPDTTLIRDGDLYLRAGNFAEVYANDLDDATVAVLAAAQRPIDPAALDETISGPATWRSLPSAALITTDDHSLPAEAQRFMASRARSDVVEIAASHAVPLSRPAEAAGLIAQLI